MVNNRISRKIEETDFNSSALLSVEKSPANNRASRQIDDADWGAKDEIKEDDRTSNRHAREQAELPWNARHTAEVNIDLLNSENRKARNMSMDVPWTEQNL